MLRVSNNSTLQVSGVVKCNIKLTKCRNFSSINRQNIARHPNTNNVPVKSARQIRQEFLTYFLNLDHTFIPSSPVVPLCDPSVAFINAGMNQFKSVFLGHLDPPARRVVNYQKCIRVGGKHNDLSAVGLDTYHHTFFEMLGNWSFSDYRKEEACSNAWNLLTNVFGISKEQLYVTYFGGDNWLGMKADLECKEIWRNLGIPESKILPLGMKDNFWEMGVTGPCGPCTEIHIDTMPNPNNDNLRDKINHGHLTELWNIVFIECQRLEDGSIATLNEKFIDTGMGFERLVRVLQGKISNYDTDLFQPLMEAIAEKSGAPLYAGRFGIDDKNNLDTGYRILTDHARMITVALADGMIPEKNYKLRKMIRKAATIATDTFKSPELLPEITNHVAEIFDDIYPEIATNLKQIQAVIKYEMDLLEALRASSGAQWCNLVKIKPQLAAISDPYAPGLVKAYEKLQTALKNNQFVVVPGEMAFNMYDTYGLDIETIQELAEIEGLTVDIRAFDKCLEDLKRRSRIAVHQGGRETISRQSIEILEANKVAKTNDSSKYDYAWNGDHYEFPVLKCKILGLIINGNATSNAELKLNPESLKNTEIGVILDKTSFYCPEGGQASDKGTICIKNHHFIVSQVQKIQDYVIHHGTFDSNDTAIELSIGSEVEITLDGENRTELMKNHTATHLLNAALRKIFPVIAQRGSFVKNDSFTFSFSSFGAKIRPEHVKSLEKLINHCIESKISVNTKIVNMWGLMAEKNLTLVPGEIYPEKGLRIVEINGSGLKSKEACCGTHVHNTEVLQHFSIVNVSSKSASNTIEATTGERTKIKVNKSIKSTLTSYLEDPQYLDDRRGAIHAYLKTELGSLIKSTAVPFIVHCLDSNISVESIPLQLAFDNDDVDLPVLLIAKSSRKIKARCFVPKKYISNSFNAQLWMESMKNDIPLTLGSFDDENPWIHSHTKVLKLPRELVETAMGNAIKTAENFALEHVRKCENK